MRAVSFILQPYSRFHFDTLAYHRPMRYRAYPPIVQVLRLAKSSAVLHQGRPAIILHSNGCIAAPSL